MVKKCIHHGFGSIFRKRMPAVTALDVRGSTSIWELRYGNESISSTTHIHWRGGVQMSLQSIVIYEDDAKDTKNRRPICRNLLKTF